MNSTIMHVNYGEIAGHSYGKKTVDDICRMAAEIGFDGIEFRGALPRELQNISFEEYAEQIAAGKKKYGLSEIIFGITVSECANTDKEKRQKNIAEAIEKAKIANKICGTTLCNTLGAEFRSPISGAPLREFEYHGSAAATSEQWSLTADTFAQIGHQLEKIGMRFAFETHMLYIHDIPHKVMKMVDEIDSPAIGVNMDYGNTVYFKEHPSIEETIDIYGEKLFYIHLKNSAAIPGTNFRIAMALSDGEINHRIYLAKLREVGFDGPIGIEAPRPGDRRYFAEQDFAYFKSINA